MDSWAHSLSPAILPHTETQLYSPNVVGVALGAGDTRSSGDQVLPGGGPGKVGETDSSERTELSVLGAGAEIKWRPGKIWGLVCEGPVVLAVRQTSLRR